MKKFTVLFAILFASNFLFAQYTRLDTSFYSIALDEEKMIDVYLPPGYYDQPDQSYPVIYHLHGGGGSQNEANYFAPLYYSAHEEGPYADSMPAAIYVCPDGSMPPFYGGYWVNSALLGMHEDYIITDVIDFVESGFRAIPDKDFRFITGYSMGGFGSMYIACSNSDKFRACGPQSAAYPTFADTIMDALKNLVFMQNGGYIPNINAGDESKFYITLSAAYAPNLELQPDQYELLWDVDGNLVDTVWTKWQNFDVSSKIQDIPPESNLDFFLLCGTIDEMINYPAYLQFEDTLSKYNFDFTSIYNEYEHGTIDYEGIDVMWLWIDSIFYQSYQTVGIDSYHQEMDFKVFPNPASSTITIELPTQPSINTSLTISNTNGQQLLTQALTNPQTEIDFSHLPVGIYVVKVWNDSEVMVRKVIKQ